MSRRAYPIRWGWAFLLILAWGGSLSLAMGYEGMGPDLPFPPEVRIPDSPLSLKQKAYHLLSRMGFGPRPHQIDELVSGGERALVTWMEKQLFPASLSDAEVEKKLSSLKTLGFGIEQIQARYVPIGQIAKEKGVDPGDEQSRKRLREEVGKENLPEWIGEELVAQKLVRAVESERQFQEVLVDFWFNHFNVDFSKGRDRWFVTSYERDAIRPHIFGRFRDLLEATATHPAMLFYLDNWLSVKDGFVPPRQLREAAGASFDPPINVPRRGINENYARELMELHTLGVDGGYTQQDVKEVARALTGWSIDEAKKGARFVFRDAAHDKGEKHILGEVIPAGGGKEDGERVLDLVAHHPATAKFIALKLCRRFVSDNPPRALVERVAQAFKVSDGDLRWVYLTLFTSPEFWSKSAYQAKIKRPFDYAVSSIRMLDGHMDTQVKPQLGRAIARMGEELYRCQPPTGYKDTAEAWVNPGALVSRLNFGMALAQNRIPGVRVDLSAIGGAELLSDPKTLMQKLDARFFEGRMSKNTRETVTREIAGQSRIMPDGESRRIRPAVLVGLLLGSPEFQRR